MNTEALRKRELALTIFTAPLPALDMQGERTEMTWEEYRHAAEIAAAPFKAHYREESFDYHHPVHLQARSPERYQEDYPVKTGYLAWGDASHHLVICLGGIANIAHRFNALSMLLKDHYYIVCPDWVGRGNSGWMRDQGDYGFDTYVEQTRQLMVHLGNRPAIMLGSSVGGSVAIELALAWPEQISRLILNDVGPFIPADRRTRRAEALARHYVFKSPSDILRKTGVAQKNDGPVPSKMRILISHEQTVWCAANGGRIYRYDIRAMQQYQIQAISDVHQWAQWEQLSCPILVIHGMESDALLPATIQRMQEKDGVTVMHIPDTGHTPALAESNHLWMIEQWLLDSPMLGNEFSSPYSHAP
jgi:pimeloyl-ACP methyl ester carboxylesterase